jgi:SAM-dependent methyltransferase
MSVATKPTIADKLEAMADGMQKAIDDKRRPMTQAPTPKRSKEYRMRIHEADDMERGQRALRALAQAHRANLVPPVLAGLKTKKEVLPLVHKGLVSCGYYDVAESPEYSNKTPQAIALQDLMEGMATEETREADAERARLKKIHDMEERIRFSPIPGFFPTARSIIDLMLERAGIWPDHLVLEPEAGKGDIAEAIRETVPDCQLYVVEIRPTLQEILTAKGFTLIGSDFLGGLDIDVSFDRIVMNPPFEKGQDIDHVRRAYQLLRPEGRLVSIMSQGPFFRSDSKSIAFREWFVEVAGEREDLPEDAFKGAGVFRQTGVSCCLVTIEKP